MPQLTIKRIQGDFVPKGFSLNLLSKCGFQFLLVSSFYSSILILNIFHYNLQIITTKHKIKRTRSVFLPLCINWYFSKKENILYKKFI